MSEKPFPFEVPFEEIQRNVDSFIDVVFHSLESEFMVMPRGKGFVSYPEFETAYETLKVQTTGFTSLNSDRVLEAIKATPLSLVVLRTMLGFSPPEWAYITTRRTGSDVSEKFARDIERDTRIAPAKVARAVVRKSENLLAMIKTACELLESEPPKVQDDRLHRLNKADTIGGLASIRNLAAAGVPYAMLLYERFLGRPFAGHRDAVSELVGDVLELAIEKELLAAGIAPRKTKKMEKITGFDQAPDFLIPDEFHPAVVIEAKVSEDPGTARDKITRIQHLRELSTHGLSNDVKGFEVVACISGRGFGVRRADMQKLLEATQGKVFTPKTLSRLVDCTELKRYRSE